MRGTPAATGKVRPVLHEASSALSAVLAGAHMDTMASSLRAMLMASLACCAASGGAPLDAPSACIAARWILWPVLQPVRAVVASRRC